MTLIPTPTWRDEPLLVVQTWLQQASAGAAAGTTITCVAPNPDWAPGVYPGGWFEHDGLRLRHRPLAVWLALADLYGCRLKTPIIRPDQWLALTFEVLDAARVPHAFAGDRAKKYEPDSPFAAVVRTEEPTFLHYYRQFLERLPERRQGRLLWLGVNQGWEVEPLLSLWSPERLAATEVVGIDHAAAAIGLARQRFADQPHWRFEATDINRLDFAALGKFDAVVAINVLHSPALNGHQVLQTLLRENCRDNCRLLFGFPNCRYLDGEVRYGTRTGKQREAEWWPLINETVFYRRLLTKNRFEVRIRGKHTVLIEAIRKQFGGR